MSSPSSLRPRPAQFWPHSPEAPSPFSTELTNSRSDRLRNHIPLRPSSAASWTRLQLASSLRSRKPYAVNLLLGGFDPTNDKPELYWIDLYGTIGDAPYAAHGYGAYFALSTMDRWHRPDMDLDEGLELLRKCINELETRFIGKQNLQVDRG